eukprot:comp23738_c1_seq1/m.40958 comp23738_c1_seq1/g.40958  ORF comp23738_c1_seq1/g.40958 comp23738_c1_seq1/m.40958 type:complete len:388 (+) comp23738_c1_seq1:855-2018(+)
MYLARGNMIGCGAASSASFDAATWAGGAVGGGGADVGWGGWALPTSSVTTMVGGAALAVGAWGVTGRRSPLLPAPPTGTGVALSLPLSFLSAFSPSSGSSFPVGFAAAGWALPRISVTPLLPDTECLNLRLGNMPAPVSAQLGRDGGRSPSALGVADRGAGGALGGRGGPLAGPDVSVGPVNVTLGGAGLPGRGLAPSCGLSAAAPPSARGVGGRWPGRSLLSLLPLDPATGVGVRPPGPADGAQGTCWSLPGALSSTVGAGRWAVVMVWGVGDRCPDLTSGGDLGRGLRSPPMPGGAKVWAVSVRWCADGDLVPLLSTLSSTLPSLSLGLSLSLSLSPCCPSLSLSLSPSRPSLGCLAPALSCSPPTPASTFTGSVFTLTSPPLAQ